MRQVIALLLSWAIVIALLLLALHIIKQLVPGPYRFVERLSKRVGKPTMNFLLFTQVKRHGRIHTLTVHIPTLFTLALIVIGVISGTWQAIGAGLLCVAVATMAKRTIAYLRRLRSLRSRLPGWRR